MRDGGLTLQTPSALVVQTPRFELGEAEEAHIQTADGCVLGQIHRPDDCLALAELEGQVNVAGDHQIGTVGLFTQAGGVDLQRVQARAEGAARRVETHPRAGRTVWGNREGLGPTVGRRALGAGLAGADRSDKIQQRQGAALNLRLGQVGDAHVQAGLPGRDENGRDAELGERDDQRGRRGLGAYLQVYRSAKRAAPPVAQRGRQGDRIGRGGLERAVDGDAVAIEGGADAQAADWRADRHQAGDILAVERGGHGNEEEALTEIGVHQLIFGRGSQLYAQGKYGGLGEGRILADRRAAQAARLARNADGVFRSALQQVLRLEDHRGAGLVPLELERNGRSGRGCERQVLLDAGFVHRLVERHRHLAIQFQAVVLAKKDRRHGREGGGESPFRRLQVL